ncbi:hypothetical protein ASD11_06595 [Aeromicrobium sp. Root495]|uniref:alpha/beta fold hydrolase n=1 Tax=Aeromicrobium sp. Root495 TaxID=1736550 RepID=UPI0006F3BFD9|nr:alpha/beta fold hydrolase [Aeromicrobium sp. Root495]KQY59245.1 hypothetical protein ASD11_06595 [Aeromicrobium sp. Root495]
MSTFVLVPGAGGDPWFWSRLVPRLEDAGHRAVAVDLPGDDPEVDLEGYIDLVVRAVQGCEGPVVLVGQSFGGFSAAGAALRVPVQRLVLLNAMIPAPGESGAGWWKAVGQAQARRDAERDAGRDPEAGFDVLEVFFHDAPDDVLAEAAEHERDEVEAAFHAPWPGESWPDVPTAVLAGDDDRLFPLALQQRVAQERLGLPVAVVPGGHLNALTRPVDVAAALLSLTDG